MLCNKIRYTHWDILSKAGWKYVHLYLPFYHYTRVRRKIPRSNFQFIWNYYTTSFYCYYYLYKVLLKAELLKVILEGEWDMSGFDFESVFMLIIRLHRLISIVLNFTGCWAVKITSAFYFVPIKFHKSNDHHPQPQFIMSNLYVINWVLLNNDKWPYIEIYMMIYILRNRQVHVFPQRYLYTIGNEEVA